MRCPTDPFLYQFRIPIYVDDPPCVVNLGACQFLRPPRVGKILQLLAKYDIFYFGTSELLFTYGPHPVEVGFDVSGLLVGTRIRGIGKTEVSYC